MNQGHKKGHLKGEKRGNFTIAFVKENNNNNNTTHSSNNVHARELLLVSLYIERIKS